MTTFLLIRHAMHALVGKGLAGRMPGVHLSAAGVEEARRLAARLSSRAIDAVYASPRERAQETAAPLAEALRLPLGIRPALDDIDFGSWTGATFAELEADPQWPVWCQRRTFARPPGGETIMEAQARMVSELSVLAAAHAGETVALFAHCDPIKATLAHYLAIHLDGLERFEIAPASVSIVALGEGWAKVTQVNAQEGAPG